MGHGLTFDVAHLLAGGLVLVSFLMITQHRLYALLNAFALQAMLLSASVAWQAYVQHAPHLYVTALIALVVEISVAFSVLIAFFVIGVFLFRIRERFDTVDVQALDRFRGERR